jgi:hypothetical protein
MTALGELKSTKVDGARLAYLEAGPVDGEPVVLLHGYPANHRCWRHQIPVLAEAHRVLALLSRLARGRFMEDWLAGAPVLVLETVSRRSGRKRCAPVLYLRDGDALVVLAANAGADRQLPLIDLQPAGL